MSDRKYRQRGYQDDGRDRERPKAAPRPPPEPGAPAGARRLSRDAPKAPNMPGYREVVRCAQCGTLLQGDLSPEATCTKCGTDLHACVQCVSFDPSCRFECAEPVPARITPKTVRNTCTRFSPRTTVERETTTPKPDNARKAFDDLFKW